MNPSRLTKTFADYAAIAVCPILIMLVVGSLVFFLLEIGYAGSHVGKLRWIMFWFVLAMVLVSRISIEKGYDHAGIYGLGLGAATALLLLQSVGSHLAVWFLLGLIWWATNKLTWDCTVIEDDQDASGEGLLQAAEIDPPDLPPAAKSKVSPPSLPTRTHPPKPTWWQALFGKRATAANQPHAPGIWVIYFSLGSLPLFGLGQALIPAQNLAGRRYGFTLLCIYLAAALGLLLLTSFLGLRRYLRQRHLEMPAAMSATWITMGSVLGLAILIGCILLPRPNADWSLTAMIDRIGDPPKKVLKENGTRPEPDERSPHKDRSAKDDGGTKGREAQGDPQQSASDRQPGQQPQGDPQQAPDANRQVDGKKNPASGGSSEQVQPSSAPPTPAFPNPPRLNLSWLKTALYVALALAILFVIWKNWERLWRLVGQFLRALQEFWNHLFYSRRAEAVPKAANLPPAPAHPFAAFTDPFSSGEAGQKTLQELIVYTFNGLEAWATEHQCGRRPDQTPSEFAEQLGEQVPDFSSEVQQVTRLYIQVAFAKTSSFSGCEPVLEALWQKMTSELPSVSYGTRG